MTEDAPKKCPIRPEKKPSGVILASPPGPGAEMQDCIGERCQWWWKCREPEPFIMTWTPIISGTSSEEVADSINEAAQKLEVKISTEPGRAYLR